MDIKPIETHYNGYRFRSRIEARWAVFFDALDVKYQYEPEGFDLGEAGWYLPDFWLPSLGYWIEIKAEEPTDEERQKAFDLSRGKQEIVLLISGPPGVTEDKYANVWFDRHTVEVFAGEVTDDFPMPSPFMNHVFSEQSWQDLAEFLNMRTGKEYDHQTAIGKQEIVEADIRYYEEKYNKPHPRWEWGRHYHDHTLRIDHSGTLYCQLGLPISTADKELLDAHLAAQQARFEHGETPQT